MSAIQINIDTIMANHLGNINVRNSATQLVNIPVQTLLHNLKDTYRG